MRKLALLMIAVVGTALAFASGAFAAGNLSKQDPITVVVHLGKDGVEQHKFYPDKLTFETGKLYKLVLHNPSNSKHYFTSFGMAHAVWTRKVQVMDDFGAGAKTIAEVKGEFTDLGCSIKDKDGKIHAENGMKGTISII